MNGVRKPCLRLCHSIVLVLFLIIEKSTNPRRIDDEHEYAHAHEISLCNTIADV